MDDHPFIHQCKFGVGISDDIVFVPLSHLLDRVEVVGFCVLDGGLAVVEIVVGDLFVNTFDMSSNQTVLEMSLAIFEVRREISGGFGGSFVGGFTREDFDGAVGWFLRL